MASLLAAPVSADSTNGPIPGIDADSYFTVYYGDDYSEAVMDELAGYELIVLDAKGAGCTPAVVAELQAAGAIVLGYISIGEDSGAELIVHDGAGPVYQTPSGQLVHQHSGVASFYVDAVFDYDSDQDGDPYAHDGLADRNPTFGGAYVVPNSDWRWVLNTQRIGGVAQFQPLAQRSLAGLAQLVGARGTELTDRAGNFGFDGFFLDTIDTAGNYTNAGWYPWVAEAMRDTVRWISEAYPDELVMANRGIFYYMPGSCDSTYGVCPIDYTIRPYVNAVLFESYYLDSSANLGPSPYFNDNKLNIAPKLLAEANRSDGFTVLALDYHMGRSSSEYGQCFEETVLENGWSSYQSPDGYLSTIGDYVHDRLDAPEPGDADTSPPAWMNTSAGFDPQSIPAPRVGAQQLSWGANPGDVVVAWDAAKDQTPPVQYNVYHGRTADIAQASKLSAVDFQVAEGYFADPKAQPANAFTLRGLGEGTHYVWVRAEDSSPAENEDDNEVMQVIHLDFASAVVSNPVANGSVVLDGVLGDWQALVSFDAVEGKTEAGGTPPAPGSEGACQNDAAPYEAWMAHDDANLYLAYESDCTISVDSRRSLYIDTDGSRGTGFTGAVNEFPQGADYMLQGYHLWRYTGSGVDWSWAHVGSAGRIWNGTRAELYLPRNWLGNPAELQLRFHHDQGWSSSTGDDWYPQYAEAGVGYFVYRFAAPLP